MKHCLFILGLLILGSNNFIIAQQTPAEPQTKPIVLFGATLHTATGDVIQNSAIRFEKGKITFAGAFNDLNYDTTRDEVIDVTDKHVYPGFIAPNAILGLNEIDAVRPTRDHTETGELNPNVRTVIAYSTDSRVIPTVRSNGILLAQITPRGGRISGTSSIVQLDAWNWEDAVYKSDDGIHLIWPKSIKEHDWLMYDESASPKKNKRHEEIQELKQFFNSAYNYSKADSHEIKNLKLEAMIGLFDSSKTLFVHVNNVKDIITAINFVKQYKVKMVIIGGKDTWMVTDLLKENNISVILRSSHTLPGNEDEDIDQPFKTAYMLHQAGVLFCFGLDGSWGQRNLPFIAGTAAAYGLTKEEALKAITSNTAKILGIDATVGTLQVNKDATLIVSSGDVLDMKTSNIELAFINGRKIDLDNKQKALYRKYLQKYHLEE